jgi:signal peptidase I
MPRWRRSLIEWGSIALVALVLAVLVRTFVFQAYYIPSGSMLPTLGIGDRILLDKLFFSPSKLHTGDIIVFTRPPAASCGVGEKDLVKRVIGTPGETVTSRGNTVFINGQAMTQSYLPPGALLGPQITTRTIYGQTLPSVIPSGEFFVMGDNRTNSCDSRFWGYVSANEIVGKVVLDWWHNNRPAFHIF